MAIELTQEILGKETESYNRITSATLQLDYNQAEVLMGTFIDSTTRESSINNAVYENVNIQLSESQIKAIKDILYPTIAELEKYKNGVEA